MKNRVKEIRELLKMTQQELSSVSGVSRTIISDLENEKKLVVTNITLEKIATALKMRVTDIFFID